VSIRLRVIDGVTVALCAARSIPKAGDVYLDDAQHAALASKFAADFASEGRMVRAEHMRVLRRSFDHALITEVQTYNGIPAYACTASQLALREAIAVVLDVQPDPDDHVALRAREESDNPNRTWWDKTYGPGSELDCSDLPLQDGTCGEQGRPSAGPDDRIRVCELATGHEGYHRDGSVRWLGSHVEVDEEPVILDVGKTP